MPAVGMEFGLGPDRTRRSSSVSRAGRQRRAWGARGANRRERRLARGIGTPEERGAVRPADENTGGAGPARGGARASPVRTPSPRAKRRGGGIKWYATESGEPPGEARHPPAVAWSPDQATHPTLG